MNIEKENRTEQKTRALHEGHRQRLRKKITIGGFDNIESHEMLEYLLFYCIPRKDTNELSHKLLDKYGTFEGLLEADINNLSKVNGISQSSALFLTSLPALFRKYALDKLDPRLHPDRKDWLDDYLKALYIGEKNEAVYMLCFNLRYELISANLMGRGTFNMVNADKRDIINVIKECKASKILLVHNHPSGYKIPSKEDYESTLYIEAILKNMSVEFIDHMIVADNKCISMKKYYNNQWSDCDRKAIEVYFCHREYDDDIVTEKMKLLNRNHK